MRIVRWATVVLACWAVGATREASLVESPAKVQTLLAKSGFSPGLIDGRPGRKTTLALQAFQRGHNLPVSGVADDATLAALKSDGNWTATYKITPADAGWITGPIPEDWNERAKLEKSGYADMTELLAERGWCSEGFLKSLNPNVDLNTLQAGDEVTLPDVQSAPPLPKIARLTVELNEKLIRGYDASDTEILLMHCSIAKHVEKRPVGQLAVQVVALNPEYTFKPVDWPEIDNVTRPLRIAPGPRCPVGTAWVGLDKPGYGMHGTIRPQDIGKTGSHGCFRLCNWDATRLAKAVRIGTTVEVKE
jgi:lipoprotein-anchoring transpeptidase ErfK/SrfK